MTLDQLTIVDTINKLGKIKISCETIIWQTLPAPCPALLMLIKYLIILDTSCFNSNPVTAPAPTCKPPLCSIPRSWKFSRLSLAHLFGIVTVFAGLTITLHLEILQSSRTKSEM